MMSTVRDILQRFGEGSQALVSSVEKKLGSVAPIKGSSSVNPVVLKPSQFSKTDLPQSATPLEAFETPEEKEPDAPRLSFANILRNCIPNQKRNDKKIQG